MVQKTEAVDQMAATSNLESHHSKRTRFNREAVPMSSAETCPRQLADSKDRLTNWAAQCRLNASAAASARIQYCARCFLVRLARTACSIAQSRFGSTFQTAVRDQTMVAVAAVANRIAY